MVSCRGPRIIPKDTLTDIYVDMLMADQFVREENISRKQLDTMLVYEAVFNKYGYDTDDYLNSVRYYLKDPERYAKVFEDVAKRLQGEVDALEKIIEHREWLQRMGAKRPQIDSILAPFSKENVYLGLARVARDTSRYPAWFRLVAVHEDTLMIPLDSLKARKDTVEAKSPVMDDKSGKPKNPVIIQETRSPVPVRVTSKPRIDKEEIKEVLEVKE
jgi:hypothetical protein